MLGESGFELVTSTLDDQAPLFSLVVPTINNFAAQLTTREDTRIQAVYATVTPI